MLRLLLACALAAAAAAGRTAASSFACTRQDAVCTALGELYAATAGANWRNNTGWATSASGSAADYCAFYGVSCNAVGRLTRLCVLPRARPVAHLTC
jgi:hypothetical protein